MTGAIVQDEHEEERKKKEKQVANASISTRGDAGVAR